MAFDATNFYSFDAGPPGFGVYLYKSDSDDRATVGADGYFNNSDDSQNMAAGDLIFIIGTYGGFTLEVQSISSGSVVTALAKSDNIVTKTSAYTTTLTDDVILCNGTFTVTLYTAVGNGGRTLTIKNTGTGVITIDGSGSETIDGDTTLDLGVQYTSVTIVSDGTNWSII